MGRDSKRLFILTEGRSGSTWLRETLSSHSEIEVLHELLNPKKKFWDSTLRKLGCQKQYTIGGLEKIFRKHDARYVGCKIIFEQLLKSPGLTPFFQTYRKEKFILLTRKNGLRTLLSYRIAKTTKIWQSIQPLDKPVAVRVNPERLHVQLETVRMVKEMIKNLLDSLAVDYIQINYEDSFQSGKHDDMLGHISRFLDVKPQFIHSRIAKYNSYPMSELIENYDEFAQFFKNKTHYAEMLDCGQGQRACA